MRSQDVSPRWRCGRTGRPSRSRRLLTQTVGADDAARRTHRSAPAARRRLVVREESRSRRCSTPKVDRQGRLDALADDAVPAPTEASPSVRRPSGKGSPALVVATRRGAHEGPRAVCQPPGVRRGRQPRGSHGFPQARGSACEIPVDGADVRKLLGTLWFRGVVPHLSADWRTRLFDALRTSAEIPNHVVSLGRRQTRWSEPPCPAARSGGQSITAGCRSPGCRALAAIARVWGEAAIRQLQFREMAAPPATSAFASLLQAHPHAGEVGHARSAVTARLRRAKRPALRHCRTRIRDLPARSREGSSGTPESWCARL